MKSENSYALITAAKNEEKYIEKTISSVMNQTILPVCWVIVSDGSTDRTDEIVTTFAQKEGFIEFLCLKKNNERNFASQAYALNYGYSKLKYRKFAFIGSLDADISLDPDYYDSILHEFYNDPELGICGGYSYEFLKGTFLCSPYNRRDFVPGAVQMFRRQCFDEIDGFVPLKYGGLDTCAETMVKMNSWKVKSLPNIKVFHQRPVGYGEKRLKSRFRSGMMDNSLGYLSIYAFLKYLRRIASEPPIIGSLISLAGFLWFYFKEKRIVSKDFVSFLRNEQKKRLKIS